VVLEKPETGFSAYSPDLPGCITVGETDEDTIAQIKEAIRLYIEEMIDLEETVPESKGIEHYINAGLLNKGYIADKYFILKVQVNLPQAA